MIIQCTNKLLKELGLKETSLASSEGHEEFPRNLFAWHANVVRINRRKTVILMNNATRYPIVLYGLKKADFAQLDKLILAAIKEMLQLEGIHRDVIDTYMKMGKQITYSKTANRQITAWLTNTVRDVEMMENLLDVKVISQKYLNVAAARMVQKFHGQNDYYYPIEKMVENLKLLKETVCDKKLDNVIDAEYYVLNIEMLLTNHQVSRRVAVPVNFTFRHLHYIIQIVFDWQNYHLHDFSVRRENKKPMIVVTDDDPEIVEFIDEDKFDIRREYSLSLKEVFSTEAEVMYEYDFGDSWDHMITLEKIKHSSQLQAVYLDGEGERPPEDVGGEGGFDEYKRIMADEKDPEHEGMKLWAEAQKERKQTAEQINRRLKSILSSGGFSHYIF